MDFTLPAPLEPLIVLGYAAAGGAVLGLLLAAVFRRRKDVDVQSQGLVMRPYPAMKTCVQAAFLGAGVAVLLAPGVVYGWLTLVVQPQTVSALQTAAEEQYGLSLSTQDASSLLSGTGADATLVLAGLQASTPPPEGQTVRYGSFTTDEGQQVTLTWNEGTWILTEPSAGTGDVTELPT